MRAGRHVVRTTAGQLRAQRLHGPSDRARIALVGQTALLLGGDRVQVDIEVGPGACLELSDIAGTVAYHGRGLPASWRMEVRVGPDARLRYAGAPFVLGDGADVTRTLHVDLARGASAVLRETLVFGRAGQRGGRLDASSVLRRGGLEFARERLVGDATARSLPGILGGAKVLDTVLLLGLSTSTYQSLDRGGQLLQLGERDCALLRLMGERPSASLDDLLQQTSMCGPALAAGPHTTTPAQLPPVSPDP